MKHKFFTALAAAVFSLITGMVSAQITESQPTPGTNPPPDIAMAPSDPACGSNAPPVLQLNPPPVSTPLKPGIYLTKPYACMVKVPGAQPDDCSLSERPAAPPIPTLKPDLHLVPRKVDGN